MKPLRTRTRSSPRRRRPLARAALERLEDRTLLSAVPASALAGALPLDGPSASDTLTLGADPQFFSITPGAAGGLLDAKVAAGGSAVRLSLLDGGGNLVVQSDGTSAAGGDPAITEHIAGGTLYLEVQALGARVTPMVARLTVSLTTTTDPFASLPATIKSSSRIAVGDFNGDGVLDYVSSSGVYLGAGDGTFASEPAAPLPGLSASDPTALAVGRFTGVGPTELAVAAGSAVTLFQGDGSGSLQALDAVPIDLGADASIVSMAAVDVGGVGLDDLAILTQRPAGRFVEIWRNDGAGAFQQSVTIPVDPSAVGLAAGRFHGDAAADLAVLLEGGLTTQGGVVILRGNGQGAFQPGPTIPIPGNDTLLGVVAGDLNGDGRIDLAVSGTSGIIYGIGAVTLLIDDGQGAFAVRTRIPVPRDLVQVAAGDFNGDGPIDLVVTNGATPDVTVLLARGGGTYRDASPPDFAPLAVADVNGDGVADEITPLGVSLGVGDGSFRTPSGPLPGVGAGTSALLAAPLLAGNTAQDLVVANYDRGEVTILRGAGDGTFHPVGTVRVGGHPAALVAVEEDGRIDLAVADPSAGTVTLLLNDGTGFHAGPVLPTGLRPVALAAADLNGDGSADLAVVDQGDGVAPGAVLVFLGDGRATFRLAGSIAVGVQPSSIAAADLNGDGTTDLAVTNLASGSVSILIGRGGATFRAAAPVDLGVGSDPVAVVAYKPPRGGVFNLVVAERGTLSVEVLAGVGDGTFHALAPVLFQQPPLGLVVAALRPGTFPGLAVAGRSSADVAVLPGNRDGSFGNPVAHVLGPVPTGIVAAKFDGDGAYDLAIANSQSNSVSILLGNGDGTFRDGQTLPVGTYPFPLAAGDFNGDGRTDLAVGDYVDGIQPGDVRILLGNGDGTFRAVQSIRLGAGTFSIVAADLDGDGRDDLAVVDQGALNDRGAVWVLLGNRDGTFRVDRPYTVGGQPSWVAAGDFDGDGHTDLAVADSGSSDARIAGDVTVLWGDGEGRFPTSSTIDYGDAPSPVPAVVVAGNFLRRGHTDLAVLAQYSDASQPGDVTVWEFDRDRSYRALDRVPLRVDDFPIFMAAGDFLGDGSRGLAVVDLIDMSVTVLTPGPGGWLEAGDPVPIGGSPAMIAVADFNGDHRSDFAVPTQFPGALSVRLNRGEGLFSEAGDATLAAHDTVLAADLGTGVTDVFSIDPWGNILWRRGRRDVPGTFNPPLTVNPGAASRDFVIIANPAGLVAQAPLQGGQRPPGPVIASIDAHDDQVTLFAYHFEDGQFHQVGSPLPTGRLPAQIVTADLDGDGIPDLVVRNAGDGTASIFFGTGDGAFVPGPVVTLGANVSDLALAALDGPGVPDLVATDAVSGLVTVWHNNGLWGLRRDEHGGFARDPRGGFDRQSVYRAGTGASGVTTADDATAPVVTSGDQTAGLSVATFPGSGNPSLVAIGPGGRSLAVLDGLGGGRFANPRAIDLGLAFQVVRTFAPRVGGPASAVAALGRDGLAVYQDDGAGGLARATLEVRPDATGLAVADLNGDGVSDLLAGNRFGDALVLYGDGSGGFRPIVKADQQISLAVANAPDGRPVFVFSDQGRDRASVAIGAGTPVPLPAGTQPLRDPGRVTTADLAGTGTLDSIIVNSGGNSVRVYPAFGAASLVTPGAASLVTPRDFPVGDDPVSVQVADVSGDGIPDLIVANHGSNDVSVLIGAVAQGVWSSSSQLRLRAGFGPTDVAVAPFLGGPVPDLVVTDGLSNEVRVLRGLGGGFFDDVSPLVFPTGNDPVRVVPLPPDGSLPPGFVTLNAGSNDLTFIGDAGSPSPLVRTFGSGGDLPIAAVTASDPLTGAALLVVANSADGLFTVFQVDPEGLDLVDAFLAPGLAHPTALAVDAFGDIFGANAGTEEAVLLALGPGAVGAGAGAGQDALAEAGASSGLEEQLIVRVDSLGGVALAATFSTVLVEASGGPGEAGTDVVAVAVPGTVPQPLGTAPVARYGADAGVLELDGVPEEPQPQEPVAQDRGPSDELVDVLMGQDGGLDDLRRELVEDLLRDGGPPSSTSPGTGQTPEPASTPTPATVDPAGEPAHRLGAFTPRAGRLVDAALDALAVEASTDTPDGNITPARSRIGRPSWALVAGGFGLIALPLLMADVAHRRRRGGRARWASGVAGGSDRPGSPR